MNEFINLTADNIEEEHICCAIGDPKHQQGGASAEKVDIEHEGHIQRKLLIIDTEWIQLQSRQNNQI